MDDALAVHIADGFEDLFYQVGRVFFSVAALFHDPVKELAAADSEVRCAIGRGRELISNCARGVVVVVSKIKARAEIRRPDKRPSSELAFRAAGFCRQLRNYGPDKGPQMAALGFTAELTWTRPSESRTGRPAGSPGRLAGQSGWLTWARPKMAASATAKAAELFCLFALAIPAGL